MEYVQKLALVLVDAFDLDVKHAVGINLKFKDDKVETGQTVSERKRARQWKKYKYIYLNTVIYVSGCKGEKRKERGG